MLSVSYGIVTEEDPPAYCGSFDRIFATKVKSQPIVCELREVSAETIYAPIVEELISLLKQHNKWDSFEIAISQALTYNLLEIQKLGISDRSSFLAYVDTLVTSWVPSENLEGKDIYHRLMIFSFIFEQRILKDQQSSIHPSSANKPLSWLSQWLVRYAQAMGRHLDQPGSLTKESLQTFFDSPAYNMHDYIIPRGGWSTFNDFFARNFKPGYRPITALNDDSVLVSPADSTFDGSWSINSTSSVNLKNIEWSIHDLLKDSPYADRFANGKFMHSFLNTFDYHRIHTPAAGKVLEARTIEGQAYMEVVVEANAHTGAPQLGGERRASDAPSLEELGGQRRPSLYPTNAEEPINATIYAPDEPGYQFLQCRGLYVLDTPIGLVAVLPIGMAQVSSVILTAEVGTELRKGEELAYFQFGGSDVVVVVEGKSNVDFTAGLEQHYKMGEEIGRARLGQTNSSTFFSSIHYGSNGNV